MTRLISRVLLIVFLLFNGSVFAQIQVQTTTDFQRKAIVEFIENESPETVDRFYNLLRIMFMIQDFHVEERSMEEILNLAMKGAVEGLDPYSHLFLGQEAARIMRSLSGEENYVGIGATIQSINKDTVVISVINNSPAMIAGIEPGDIITRVNGKSVWGWSVQEVADAIKGQENTVVTVEIRSAKSQKPKTLELVRRRVVMISVVSRNDLVKDIGYIKISAFSSETPGHFREALEALDGKEGVVIDLRDNPGGDLDAVVKMIGYMIGPDRLVISEKNNNPSSIFQVKEVLTSDKRVLSPAFSRVNTVVLVNNFSASASEVMAGVLRHHNAATVIGVRTFGKASVQIYSDIDERFHAPEDTSMIIGLTIAKYYLPDGSDISRDGISPYIEVEQPEDFRRYEYLTERDAQFMEAVEFLKGKEGKSKWRYLAPWKWF